MPLAYVDMFAYRISNGVNPVLAKARTFPLFTPLEARAKGAADASVLPLMGQGVRNRIPERGKAHCDNNLLITMGKTVVKNRKKSIDPVRGFTVGFLNPRESERKRLRLTFFCQKRSGRTSNGVDPVRNPPSFGVAAATLGRLISNGVDTRAGVEDNSDCIYCWRFDLSRRGNREWRYHQWSSAVGASESISGKSYLLF